MSAELQTNNEFEEYDDEEGLRRLVRSIELSEKYFLFFACCNQVPKQNELIKKAKKALRRKKIEVVKFKQPIINLLGELRKILADKKPDAVFVQGLEYSISSDGENEENLAVINLNHFRDSFRELLPCPMVLWLPEYALVKITNSAPDFFSVRSGTFYFSSTPEKITEQFFRHASRSWVEDASFLIAEKRPKIETLKKLLAEYKALPIQKRDKHAERRLQSTLGNIFYSISDYRKAIEYFEQALQISREFGDRQNEGINLGNLGTCYGSLGEYLKPIEYHEQALQISREFGDRQGEGSDLGNLGNAYYNLGKIEKACALWQEAVQILDAIESPHANIMRQNIERFCQDGG